MFKELGPLLRQRTVVMILTRLEATLSASTSFPASSTKAKTIRSPLPLAWLGRLKTLTPTAFRAGPVCWSPPRIEEHARIRQGTNGGGSQGRQDGGPVEGDAEDCASPARACGGGDKEASGCGAQGLPSPGNRSRHAMPAFLTLDRRRSQLPCPRRMRTRKRRFLPRLMMSQWMSPTIWMRPRKRPALVQ